MPAIRIYTEDLKSETIRAIMDDIERYKDLKLYHELWSQLWAAWTQKREQQQAAAASNVGDVGLP